MCPRMSTITKEEEQAADEDPNEATRGRQSGLCVQQKEKPPPTLASGGGYKGCSLQPIIPNMLRAVMWLKKGSEITANHCWSEDERLRRCGGNAPRRSLFHLPIAVNEPDATL